jgi:hypothetical protein
VRATKLIRGNTNNKSYLLPQNLKETPLKKLQKKTNKKLRPNKKRTRRRAL